MYTLDEIIDKYDRKRDYEKELDKKEKEGKIESEDVEVLRTAIEFLREGKRDIAKGKLERADTMVRDLFSAMMLKKGNFVIDKW